MLLREGINVVCVRQPECVTCALHTSGRRLFLRAGAISPPWLSPPGNSSARALSPLPLPGLDLSLNLLWEVIPSSSPLWVDMHSSLCVRCCLSSAVCCLDPTCARTTHLFPVVGWLLRCHLLFDDSKNILQPSQNLICD